jgi:hypothetical protein
MMNHSRSEMEKRFPTATDGVATADATAGRETKPSATACPPSPSTLSVTDPLPAARPGSSSAAGSTPTPSIGTRLWKWAAGLALIVGLMTGLLKLKDSLFTQVPRLELKVFRITHIPASDTDDRSDIALNSGEARDLDDHVRIDVELSEPAYCMVVALNSDGSVELCYPENVGVQERIAALRYPESSLEAFGPFNKEGLQAFVFVATRKRPPSFKDWQPNLSRNWRPIAADGVFIFDGITEEHPSVLGHVEEVEGKLQPLRQIVDILRTNQDKHDLDVFRVMAFSVGSKR